ncbi:MAG TPA: ABC transporter permease [Thermoanaerobaculia bacterium]|nr:ABC transporter permease [Thermoanaerobaculia bacterium]
MRRIVALARAEVLHIVRDRTTMAQVLLLPIAQLLILANAATFVIRDTAAYVVDLDRTSTSRGLISRFAASGHFDVVEASVSLDRANEALLNGSATLVLTIPDEFERSLVRSRRAPVHLALNAEKGSAAGIVQSYAMQILADYSADVTREWHPSARPVRPIEVRTRAWYNPSQNYKHYMVPGILVALVTLVSTLLASQNIAREKELGTLEQLNVTPITRGEFIVAKLLPYWVLGMIILAIGLVAGKLAFDIPIRGSVMLLFGCAAVYLVVTLAIGLFVSALVETQQQAMFVTFFVMNVYLLLSGLFTPIDSMAPWVQVVSQVNPVRHFVGIARAILVKGAGPAELVQPMAILLVFAAVMLTLAIRQYRKRSA